MTGHTHGQFNIAIWVAAGGALGSVIRYLLLIWLGSVNDGSLPWGTLVANICGSFLLGGVAAYAAGRGVGWNMQFFVSVGILGGFTTFSFFSVENLTLVQQGKVMLTMLNASVHTLFGVGAAWSGFRIFRKAVPA